MHVASIQCPACPSYGPCGDIERRYGPQLEENGDQYKLLSHVGPRPTSPLRRCSNTFFERELESMRGREVLEIGCGQASRFTPAVVRATRIRYTGIDTVLPRRGLPLPPARGPAFLTAPARVAIRAANRWILSPVVNQLHRWKPGPRIYHVAGRFPHRALIGRTFGVVYSSNSIEHWHEDLPGSSGLSAPSPSDALETSLQAYRADLAACYELLEPGGRLILDAPIHLHGNGLFYRGRIAEIERVFAQLPWSELSFEHWRKDPGDLRRYLPGEIARDFAGSAEPVVNLWQLTVIARR